jgi:hypothetical protein
MIDRQERHPAALKFSFGFVLRSRVGELLRWAQTMQPWSMNEVMILGILVALIKIAELAAVTAGIGMYAMFGLVVLFPAIALSIDEHETWKRIEWADGREPPGFAMRGAGGGKAGHFPGPSGRAGRNRFAYQRGRGD